MSQHVFTDTVDPSAAPPSVGAHWINTATGNQWFSKGTASVADWVLGGGGGGGLSQDAFYQVLMTNLQSATQVHLSNDSGRTYKETPVDEATSTGGSPLLGPFMRVTGGAPQKCICLINDAEGTVIVSVTVDNGLTWTRLDGNTGWAYFDTLFELVGGYDSRNEYMLINGGSGATNNRVWFYNGTSWSRKTATGFSFTTAPIDLQGGLNNAFYCGENDAGTWSIVTTTDGGTTWTDYVNNFQAGQGGLTALAIDPDVGLLAMSQTNAYFSADGVTAPSLVTGSTMPASYVPFIILAGNGRFSIWARNGTACKVFGFDGTTWREGHILAFNQTTSSPDSSRVNGVPFGMRGGWDGTNFAALISTWQAGSTEAGTMLLQSEDGLVWTESAYQPANTTAVSVTRQSWGVVSQ